MASTLLKKDLCCYGVMAMPLAFAGIPLYIHAPDFYATQYGISFAHLGGILVLLRLIDALQDPIIGYFSDAYSKCRTKTIFVGSILLAVSFTVLFTPLTGMYLLWFTLFMTLATTVFSVLTITLNTIGGLWSTQNGHKTKIVAYREAFGIIGLTLAVTLPSILQNHMPKQEAFLYVVTFLSLLIIVSLCFFAKWQKNHSNSLEIKSDNSLRFRDIASIGKQTKNFFTLYGMSMLASSIPAVLVLFFIRDLLKLQAYVGVFLLAYFFSGALGIILSHYVSKRIGKHKTWLLFMLLITGSFVWAYFLDAGDFWAYLSICLVSAVAFGAELVLPASILADHMQKTKREYTVAIHFGILTFLTKVALALAVAITLPYLDVQGFVAGTHNTYSALHALRIGYVVILCLIKVLSTYILWRIIYEQKTMCNTNRSSTYA